MRNFDWNSKSGFLAALAKRHGRTSSFWSSESGLMTIMALFFMLIIFTAAGFAVDVMRFDRERARLQYSLDRPYWPPPTWIRTSAPAS